MPAMIRVIFHWHAFLEIKGEGFSLLLDPFVSGNPKADVSLEQVLAIPELKWIALTHWHDDHLGDTVPIAKAREEIKVIATFELAQYLQNVKGLKNVHSMHIGGKFDFGDFVLKYVPAIHGGGIDDLQSTYTTVAGGILVKIWDKKIYHAGDTALTMDMKLLEQEQIDVAFLPIGDNSTMGIEDAVRAVEFIKPKIVVPIHYGTWPVIDTDPTEFARQVMLQDIAKPKVLNPGDELPL